MNDYFNYLSQNTSYGYTLCWDSKQRQTATENRGIVYFPESNNFFFFSEDPGFGGGSGGVLAPPSVEKFNYWNDDQTKAQKTSERLKGNPTA